MKTLSPYLVVRPFSSPTEVVVMAENAHKAKEVCSQVYGFCNNMTATKQTRGVSS